MSKSRSPSRVRAIYEVIKAHSASFPVQVSCRVLEVAPIRDGRFCAGRGRQRGQFALDGAQATRSGAPPAYDVTYACIPKGEGLVGQF